MDTRSKKAKRTLLSSMEDVVTKAKEMSITPEFYKAAALSLKHLSTVLQLTQEEAMLLTLFFEMSSSARIWISNIAEMVNTSNLRIISMMNVADSLISKGYLKKLSNKFTYQFPCADSVISTGTKTSLRYTVRVMVLPA